MANNNDQFKAFNTSIKLSNDKKDELLKNRKALRKKIKKYFEENKPDEIQPKFHSQGSFEMNTTVNPIPVWSDEDDKNLYKYDIDDGVYFIGDEDQDDRYSIQTYHNWIYDAVDGHTGKDPIDKNTCVRVIYADGHNIDLPIYYKKGDIPELAHKTKGWIESDPKEFYEWFNEETKTNRQLRRIVRYLKAWKDYRESSNSQKKMPSGFILTILATDNIAYSKDRDDIALKDTLKNIKLALDSKFECLRPTSPKGEDLLNGYANKDYFLNELDKFVTSAEQAINGSNPKDACMKWQKHFGDRFCCSTAKDIDEKATSFSSPAVVPSTTSA